ncbi:MAG: hypothetical protein ACE5IL_00475 [Myxococcota bacterium]
MRPLCRPFRFPVAGLPAAAVLIGLSLACGPGGEGALPWGFDRHPLQRFRLQSNADVVVDGEPVRVQQLAEVHLVLRSDPDPGGDRPELALFLERYYSHTQGGPGGESELALSHDGLVSRIHPDAEVVLAPGDPAPGGQSVLDLLAQPLSGVFLSGAEPRVGTPWHSHNPVLSQIRLIDWLLFALPPSAPEGVGSWEVRRWVPTVGRYDLGIELALRQQRTALDSEGAELVRSSGLAQRRGLRIAPGLTGDLRLDTTGEAKVGPDGRVRQALLELRMQLHAPDGREVSARYRLDVQCLECEEAVNPAAETPDTLIQ